MRDPAHLFGTAQSFFCRNPCPWRCRGMPYAPKTCDLTLDQLWDNGVSIAGNCLPLYFDF